MNELRLQGGGVDSGARFHQIRLFNAEQAAAVPGGFRSALRIEAADSGF
jgi:hypothetical protein